MSDIPSETAPRERTRVRRLGFSILNSHPEVGGIEEQIPLIAAAGFDSFFLSCGVTEAFFRIPVWAELALHAGTALEAVHAPTDGVNALWLPASTVETDTYLARARRIIGFCAEGGVEKLVLHVAYGQPHPVTPVGLARFSALEEFASTRGVSLCYENASVAEHTVAVVQNASPGHGFCHDTGHNQCYTPDTDYPALCGEKLLYTHLHDNRGSADEHLLPYDGSRDWGAYAAALARVGYRGTLNAELSCTWQEEYRKMPYEAFLSSARARLLRLEREICDAETANTTSDQR